MLDSLTELRQRFVRINPNGQLDLGMSLRNLVQPTSTHELPPETYLATLTAQDREHIQDFLTFTRSLGVNLRERQLAVIAVGSSVRPESQRYHPIRDIDLRILNNTPVNIKERQRTVEFITDFVRDYLKKTRMEFEENKTTVSQRMVLSTQRELVPYVDWYNRDPSFKVSYPEGLPLHISISGPDNWDLETYLRRERQHNACFSLLYQGSSV